MERSLATRPMRPWPVSGPSKLYGCPRSLIDELESANVYLAFMMPVDPRGHGRPRATDPIVCTAYFPYDVEDSRSYSREPKQVLHGSAATAVEAVTQIRDQIWQGL